MLRDMEPSVCLSMTSSACLPVSEATFRPTARLAPELCLPFLVIPPAIRGRVQGRFYLRNGSTAMQDYSINSAFYAQIYQQTKETR